MGPVSSCFGGVDTTPSHAFSVIDEESQSHKNGSASTVPSRISYFGMKRKKIQPLQVFHKEQPIAEVNNVNIIDEEKPTNHIPSAKNSATRSPDRLNDIFSRRISNLSGDVGLPLSGMVSPFPEPSPTMTTAGTIFGSNTPLAQSPLSPNTRTNRSEAMTNSLAPGSYGNSHVQDSEDVFDSQLDAKGLKQSENGLVKSAKLGITNLLKPILQPSAPFTTPRNVSKSSEYYNRDSIKNGNFPRECFSVRLRAVDQVDEALVKPLIDAINNQKMNPNNQGDSGGVSNQPNMDDDAQVSYANSMRCESLLHTSTEVPKGGKRMRVSAIDRTQQILLTETISPGLSIPLMLCEIGEA